MIKDTPTKKEMEMVDTQDVVYSVISKYGVDEKQLKKIWSK